MTTDEYIYYLCEKIGCTSVIQTNSITFVLHYLYENIEN